MQMFRDFTLLLTIAFEYPDEVYNLSYTWIPEEWEPNFLLRLPTWFFLFVVMPSMFILLDFIGCYLMYVGLEMYGKDVWEFLVGWL